MNVDEPDALADPRDAHGLAGEHVTRTDLAPVEADSAAVRHGERRSAKRVAQGLEAAVNTRRARVEVRGHFRVECLVRPLVIVAADEGIEPRLLLQDVR